jgi:hypothetical protein
MIRDNLTTLITVFLQQKPEAVLDKNEAFNNTTIPEVTIDKEGNTIVDYEKDFIQFYFNSKGEFLGIFNYK